MLLLCTTHAAGHLGQFLDIQPNGHRHIPLDGAQAHGLYWDAGDDGVSLVLLVKQTAPMRGPESPYYAADYPQEATFLPNMASLSRALMAMFEPLFVTGASRQVETDEKQNVWTVHLPAVRSSHGAALVARLFEPLGFRVLIQSVFESTVDFGEGSWLQLSLEGEMGLRSLIGQLCVLLPLLDDSTYHYAASQFMTALRQCDTRWVHHHPERDTLLQPFVQQMEEGEGVIAHATTAERTEANPSQHKIESLSQELATAICDRMSEHGVRSVVDLVCGAGDLLRYLVKVTQFSTIIGVDPCVENVQQAQHSLPLEAGMVSIQMLLGSPLYRDRRIAGVDGVVMRDPSRVLPKDRLDIMADVVLGGIAPRVFIVTSSNRDHRGRGQAAAKGPRHGRGWRQEQFEGWCREIAAQYAVHVSFYPVGELDQQYTAPTQMAVFLR